MRHYLIFIFILCFILNSCAPQILRVSDEFLTGISTEESKRLDRIEREIVAVSEDRDPIMRDKLATELKIQIKSLRLERLDMFKELLGQKSQYHTLIGDDLSFNLVQQEIIKNDTRIGLKKLELVVLNAQAEDNAARLNVNRKRLSKKIAERSLERAKIARTRQDTLYGDNPEKASEKYDLGLFEEQLNKADLVLRETENAELLAQGKVIEAETTLERKKQTVSLLDELPLRISFRDTSSLRNSDIDTIRNAIKVTHLEYSLTDKEINILRKKETILIDRLRLHQFLNDSIAQKEEQRLIQLNKQTLTDMELFSRTILARQLFEEALIEFKEAEAALAEEGLGSAEAAESAPMATDTQKSPELETTSARSDSQESAQPTEVKETDETRQEFEEKSRQLREATRTLNDLISKLNDTENKDQ